MSNTTINTTRTTITAKLDRLSGAAKHIADALPLLRGVHDQAAALLEPVHAELNAVVSGLRIALKGLDHSTVALPAPAPKPEVAPSAAKATPKAPVTDLSPVDALLAKHSLAELRTVCDGLGIDRSRMSGSEMAAAIIAAAAQQPNTLSDGTPNVPTLAETVKPAAPATPRVNKDGTLDRRCKASKTVVQTAAKPAPVVLPTVREALSTMTAAQRADLFAKLDDELQVTMLECANDAQLAKAMKLVVKAAR